MRWLAAALLVALVLFACTRATDADRGTDALFQVANAQFFRGSMPAGTTGPGVKSVTLGIPPVAGSNDNGLSGDLASTATAVAIGLDGDFGYWVVGAAVPSTSDPSLPTFQAGYGIASTVSPGTHEIIFRGVDANGNFGPAESRALTVVALDANARFVISLDWSNAADLDLHVVIPDGIEIFNRNPTEYQRPSVSAGPVLPDASIDGGYLDQDSNAHCVTDGQQREDVIWRESPPKGHYIVRVDTFSLCGVASAPWKITATLNGVVIGGAQGEATVNDQRFSHDRGGGLLALELDVP